MSDADLATVKLAVEQALTAAWSQYEALNRLAAHYPEASGVLNSPRKPDVIVILERLNHWLAARPRDGAQGSGGGGL